MGAGEVATLDAPVGRPEIPGGLIAPHGGRMDASRLMRLVCMCVAAAVILVVSIGGATAQPKKILFLHSFGPNFQQAVQWSNEIRSELNRQSPWPLDIQEHSLVTARYGDA